MILWIKGGEIMDTMIGMVILGILIGFTVRVYQESGPTYFIGTFLASLVLLPTIYIVTILGAVPALYFARKKKEYLIDIFIKFAPQKIGGVGKNDEQKKITLNKYWMRLCVSLIFSLWKSLDTISCLGIAAMANIFREKQPLSKIKDALKSKLYSQIDTVIHAVNIKLTKLQET